MQIWVLGLTESSGAVVKLIMKLMRCPAAQPPLGHSLGESMVSESVWAFVVDMGKRMNTASRRNKIKTKLELFRIVWLGLETCHHYTIWLQYIISLINWLTLKKDSYFC
jgi:hypothetical protein